MRAALAERRVTLDPGRPVTVTVEVTNTSDVIDGVTARIDAGPGLDVRSQPPVLPLFPDGTGVITLELAASDTFPAGTYDLAVDVRSSVHVDDQLRAPLQLEVVPEPRATLEAVPPVRSARHKSSYSIVCDNTGNTPLEITLAASDPERVVRSRFSPATVVVEPGATGTATMHVRARRHFFGAELGRPIAIVGTAGDLNLDTRASFRQMPVVPRGVRTVLILGTIIAIWAAVFVVAIDKALTKDALTKTVPPSFYAASAAAKTGSTKVAQGPGGSFLLQSAADSSATPAGAVPKSGVVIGIGGTISGTVRAKSTSAGIGRITVEAVEDTPTGPTLLSSAASGTDGSYSLDGLLPGPYKLLFTAQGYQDTWYPDAASEAAATPVNVDALATTPGVDVVITGANGTITGKVDTGQTPAVPVIVTVLPGQGSTTPIAKVATDAAGNYTVGNLPAPGAYDLSFSAAGYQVASDTEQLAGGEQRIAGMITLTAGPGTLGGTVTDGTKPLGGVTITANANGQTITSATPTTGTVGQFTIPNLATPATYLLTFTKSGYGPQTVAEHLGPGQSIANLSVAMSGGAGQISGLVTSPSGAPLGGVTVTVGGGAAPVTTQTLTAGTVGTYQLSGLTTPGSYTLTFSLAGYASETVGVNLGSSGSSSGVNVTLPVYSGTITGAVSGKSGALTGVAVTVTNGVTIRTTVSSSNPPGGYSVSGLAPGSWSVTFSATGYLSETALVILQPGQTATVPVTLTPAG